MSDLKPIDSLLSASRVLISQNEFEAPIELLNSYSRSLSDRSRNAVSILSANIAELDDALISGATDPEVLNRRKNGIRQRFLMLVDRIEKEFEVASKLSKNALSMHLPNDVDLESIIGSENVIQKITFLKKAINVSKAVVLVQTPTGQKGTGFLVDQHFLLTNNHVIPSSDIAKRTTATINFEDPLEGEDLQPKILHLDPSQMINSPVSDLDFCYVKIDLNKHASDEWESLPLHKLDTLTVGDRLSIIHHPEGNTKSISMHANHLLDISSTKLMYTTDTMKGSSGSPVFDNSWNVVGIHQGGDKLSDKTYKDPRNGSDTKCNVGIQINCIIDQINKV